MSRSAGLVTASAPRLKTWVQADDPHGAFKVRQHSGDFLPTEHDGETKRLFSSDDVLNVTTGT